MASLGRLLGVDRLRKDWLEQRQRLLWELANCGTRDCAVHADDWAVLATCERFLGVERSEPVPRRAWWEA